MLWVDSDQYYGPDRRRLRAMRMRDRRRMDVGNRLPAIHTALLQLRMRTLDAEGNRLPPFIVRVKGTAVLAQMHGEIGVTRELQALAGTLQNARGDVRPIIYAALDRAQAQLG